MNRQVVLKMHNLQKCNGEPVYIKQLVHGPSRRWKRNDRFSNLVITGGDSGLDFACASAILMSPHGAPWRVVLACRDEGRAQAAVDQLTSDAGVAGQVEAMSLDLASLASVRAFAAELTKRLSTGTTPPLHAVVCNASAAPYGRSSCTGAPSARVNHVDIAPIDDRDDNRTDVETLRGHDVFVALG
jgi:NAD(P)-dependent dehydrogenase (short-subunit alcohol dehydrogenase family)